MCLYLKADKEPEVLKEDLIVFKYGKVRDDQFTPVWKTAFIYEKGVLTDNVDLVVKDNNYYDPKEIKELYPNITRISPNVVEKGYHAYTGEVNPAILGMYAWLSKTRQISGGYRPSYFTIPKGSIVYRCEESNEIVSNQIIWNG